MKTVRITGGPKLGWIRKLFYLGEGENQRIVFCGELNKEGVSIAFNFKPSGCMSRSGRTFEFHGIVWIRAGRRKARLIYEFEANDRDVAEGSGELQIQPVEVEV